MAKVLRYVSIHLSFPEFNSQKTNILLIESFCKLFFLAEPHHLHKILCNTPLFPQQHYHNKNYYLILIKRSKLSKKHGNVVKFFQICWSKNLPWAIGSFMIPISSPPTLNPKPTSSFKNPGEWEVFNKIKELPNTALNANFCVSSKNHRDPPMSIEFSAYPFLVKSKNPMSATKTLLTLRKFSLCTQTWNPTKS